MANQNKPFGLAPVRNISASKFNEAGTRYYIPSTDTLAYYIGDVVISAAAGDANGVCGVIKDAAGTSTERGVIVGVEVSNVNGVSLIGTALSLENTAAPAVKLKDYYVYVVDDPDVLFSVQGDLTATNQVATKVNNNSSLTITAGATLTSCSGTVINSSTIATTAALNVKLMGLLQIPNNAFGAYSVWQCKINQHELMGGTAGV
jgi:hypothetical protein